MSTKSETESIRNLLLNLTLIISVVIGIYSENLLIFIFVAFIGVMISNHFDNH